MTEKQYNKYIVIKRDDLRQLMGPCKEIFLAFLEVIQGQIKGLRELQGRPTENKYIVCNQNEPYAEEVWKLILENEEEKGRSG